MVHRNWQILALFFGHPEAHPTVCGMSRLYRTGAGGTLAGSSVYFSGVTK
jgi:hypothetical protein